MSMGRHSMCRRQTCCLLCFMYGNDGELRLISGSFENELKLCEHHTKFKPVHRIPTKFKVYTTHIYRTSNVPMFMQNNFADKLQPTKLWVTFPQTKQNYFIQDCENARVRSGRMFILEKNHLFIVLFCLLCHLYCQPKVYICSMNT